jgi:hypothetical protein
MPDRSGALRGVCRPLPRSGRGRYVEDTDLLHRAAAWLRADPAHARAAGLTGAEDVTALVALLDLVAAMLPHLDPAVRRDVVASCRAVLEHG